MQARLLATALGGLVLGGCAAPRVEVAVEEPIAFPHQVHLAYFASGQHRREKIRMHLEILGETEPPPELAEGRCVACHDDLPARTACAGCHVLFQDATLRERKQTRRCVACHRGAWVRTAATMPDNAVCAACHDAPPSDKGTPLVRAVASRSDAHGGGRAEAATATDGPAVRLEAAAPKAHFAHFEVAVRSGAGSGPGSLAPNVYFSHRAHVGFAALACTRCHADPSGPTAPGGSASPLSMGECVRCHEENGASTDCLTCHK